MYAISLVILLHNALSLPITSDRLTEFKEYQRILDNGNWQPTPDSLVNSSLVTIYAPAIVSGFTHLDPVIVFKIFPSIFQAFIPIFVYLIARRYMNHWLSLLSALFVMSQYNFLYNSNIGRVGIGMAFFVLFVWALLNKKYIWAVASAILLVFSHYGTAMVAVIIGAVTFVYIAITDIHNKRRLIKFAIVMVVLSVFIYGWYFVFAEATGKYIQNFINSSIGSITVVEKPPSITPANNGTLIIIDTPREPSVFETMLSMNNKEYILQMAFGLKLGEMNYYQKIEWVVCWIIIILLLMGIGLAIWRKRLKELHLYMTIVGLLIILSAILVPYISMKYGIVRVYFTALLIFAPFFVYGLAELSRELKINQYILPSVMIGINAVVICGSAPPYLFGLIT
jgi:uncharacterized membrane protein